MSEMRWIVVVLVVLVALAGIMIYGERAGEQKQSEAKAEALVYAKQGWVYNCGGWQCRWERIKP